MLVNLDGQNFIHNMWNGGGQKFHDLVGIPLLIIVDFFNGYLRRNRVILLN